MFGDLDTRGDEDNDQPKEVICVSTEEEVGPQGLPLNESEEVMAKEEQQREKEINKEKEGEKGQE